MVTLGYFRGIVGFEMMGFENIYFIAIIPPPPVREQVVEIQQDLAARFHTSAALRVVPHITLKAPFKVPLESHTEVLTWFRELNPGMGKFDVDIHNYSCFPNPKSPVIYLNPIPAAHLMNLQKNVIGAFMKAFPLQNVMTLEIDYKPHMTVAYRDLAPEFFEVAWAEFESKKFDGSFPVNKIYLMQHNGKRWNEIGSYDLA